MPTTTATAQPRAKENAEIFGDRLRKIGWDVEITCDEWPKSPTSPARVRYGVKARRDLDLMTFSWTTVTDADHPRTTKYQAGKLHRPLAAARADQVVSLRTVRGLNDLLRDLGA
jgi:hypothetical protein